MDIDEILFRTSSFSHKRSETGNANAQVTCLCCNETELFPDWSTHEATANHALNRKKQLDLVKNEKKLWEHRSDAARLESRIGGLMIQSDKDAVNAKLLRYVLNPNEALDTVENLLEHHEHLDRVALLELVVWKAACFASKPKREMSDVMDMMDWMRVGWKEWKDETRTSAMFTVIMPQVIRFLDEK